MTGGRGARGGFHPQYFLQTLKFQWHRVMSVQSQRRMDVFERVRCDRVVHDVRNAGVSQSRTIRIRDGCFAAERYGAAEVIALIDLEVRRIR